jgi:hypothetical protein
MAARQAETPQAASSRTADARPLGAAERVRLAAEVVGAYLLARGALRSAPIAVAVARLRSSPTSPASAGGTTETTLAEAHRLGRAVARTLRLVPGDTRCLVSSLVLTRLLARRGIPAKLVIGARTAPDFLAHAWVEYGGDPVLPPGDESFGRLVEL